MKKKGITLDDIAGSQEKLEFSAADLKEGVQKFIGAFGEFSRKSMHQFYDKHEIADVVWHQRLHKGGSKPLPFGRVVGIREFPGIKGTKIWKDYEARSDFLYMFWEEFYNQANKLIAKEEYIERKKLESFAEIEQTTGEEIYTNEE